MNQDQQHAPEHEDIEAAGKFRGWRLLGVLALVVGSIALISALVDWLFIGGFISLD